MKKSIAFLLLPLFACQTIKHTEVDQSFRKYQPKASDPVVTRLPRFSTFELENGLKVYVATDKSLPIAQVKMVFKAGSAYDPKHKAGTAGLSYNMLTQGAASYDALGFEKEFAKLGTIAPSVSVTQDSASLTIPVLRSNLKQATRLLSLCIKAPHYHSKDFTRLRERAVTGLDASISDPRSVATEAFFAAAYGNSHPYGHLARGTKRSVGQITLDDVRRYWHNHVRSENAALIFTGDVTVNQAKALAKEFFKHWHLYAPAQAKLSQDWTLKSLSKNQIKLINRPHASQTFVMLGKPLIKVGNPNYPIYEILNQIAGGLFSSRINLNLREGKGWTYGVGSYVNPLVHEGPFILMTSIQVPYGALGIGEIFSEFAQLREKLISPSELDLAKNSSILSFAGNFSTIQGTANMAESLFTYDLQTNYYSEWLKQMQAVSAEDVKRAAQTMLNANDQTVIAVGDLSALEEPLKEMNLGSLKVY